MAKSGRQENKDYTLVLIGSVGSGKSSTGNTIAGKKIFSTGAGTSGKTRNIQKHDFYQKETKIKLIDTPGLQNPSDFSTIIKTSFSNPQHNTVFAVVISIGRFTSEEKQLLPDVFLQIEKNKAKAFLIFTRRNDLDDQDLKSWLDEAPKLRKWINSYNLSCISVENKSKEKNKNEEETRKLHEFLEQFQTTIKPNNEVSSGLMKMGDVATPNERFNKSEEITKISFNRILADPRETVVMKKREVQVSEERLKTEFGSKGEQFFRELYSEQYQ